MAIGPDSRRMASGRIVVIAIGDILLGAMSTLVGIGPQVEGAEIETRVAGAVALLLGSVLMIAGIALGLRVRHAQKLGAAGAAAAVLVGAMVTVLALDSFGACTADGAAPTACQALVGSVVVVGISICVLGLTSGVIIRRSPRDAFRRYPRT